MEVADHLAQLRVDGDLMAEAASAAGADVKIPTCPEWTMRDLVHHQGQVHRWANAHVAGALTEPLTDESQYLGPIPDDSELVDWFRSGHQTLIDTLEGADPAVECWTFGRAPSARAFWARRQCHETGIHRADAESALGEMTAFPADVAADGIDEMLSGIITRPSGKLRSETPRRLAVETADATDRWLLQISTDPVVTERGAVAESADCVIRGTASDIHLFLWNRVERDRLSTSGDVSLLDLWRDSVTIRW